MLRLTLLTLLAAPAFSQITVDPNGGGHFTDLQMAIDVSPSGATIVVRGGTYYVVTIDKSLALIGDPDFTLETEEHYWQARYTWSPALTIRGTGVETVTLVGLVSRPSRSSITVGLGNPAIACHNIDSLSLYDCDLAGIQLLDWELNGNTFGHSAVMSSSACEILSINTRTLGSDAHTDALDTWGNDGPPGIDNPHGTVILGPRSLSRGGDGGEYYGIGGPPGFAGLGGAGVACSELLSLGGRLEGGQGGEVWFFMSRYYAGRAQAGPAYVATTYIEETAPLILVEPACPRVGSSASILGPGYAPPPVYVIGPRQAPRMVLGVFTFLDPTAAYPFFTSSAPIPADANLLGLEFCIHGFTTNLEFSRPAIGVVRP